MITHPKRTARIVTLAMLLGSVVVTPLQARALHQLRALIRPSASHPLACLCPSRCLRASNSCWRPTPRT